MRFAETIYRRSPIPLQTLLLNMKAVELYFERYGGKFRKLYKEFEQNQWLSAGELEDYQNDQLKALIRHAYETVPYYSQLMRSLNLHPDDIKRASDLPKLPTLTKEIIRQNFSGLLSTKYPKTL